jgi:hypothetical protein
VALESEVVALLVGKTTRLAECRDRVRMWVCQICVQRLFEEPLHVPAAGTWRPVSPLLDLCFLLN